MDSYIAALGTALTAVFTGVIMWHTLIQHTVRVTSFPDGSFTVYNPKGHTVVIRDLVVGEGTLWNCVTGDKGRPEWGDSGETRIAINRAIAPGGEERFHQGIYLNGQRRSVIGKGKRIALLQPSPVDIVLYPSANFIREEEET